MSCAHMLAAATTTREGWPRTVAVQDGLQGGLVGWQDGVAGQDFAHRRANEGAADAHAPGGIVVAECGAVRAGHGRRHRGRQLGLFKTVGDEGDPCERVGDHRKLCVRLGALAGGRARTLGELLRVVQKQPRQSLCSTRRQAKAGCVSGETGQRLAVISSGMWPIGQTCVGAEVDARSMQMATTSSGSVAGSVCKLMAPLHSRRPVKPFM